MGKYPDPKLSEEEIISEYLKYVEKCKKKHGDEHYTIAEILKKNAAWNLIISGKGNGKSYAMQEYAIFRYLITGTHKYGMLRRFDLDFKGNKGPQMFANQICNGYGENNIYEMCKFLGVPIRNSVHYYRECWYLMNTYVEKNKNGDDITVKKKDEEPFAFAFAMSAYEHINSVGYPNVYTIHFDEFISNHYLTSEYVNFKKMVNSIKRRTPNVKIFMTGNTLNYYNPYFKNMGLKHVKEQKIGSIDIYKVGSKGSKLIAVERADMHNDNAAAKDSDEYFAFDDPTDRMMTEGEFDIPDYPLLMMPEDFKIHDYSIFQFYIEWEDLTIRVHILSLEIPVLYAESTTDLIPPGAFVYSDGYKIAYNYRRNLLVPEYPFERTVLNLIAADKLFYDANDTAVAFNAYLGWCKKEG